jgi:ATP-dependent DNA ligase
MAERKATARFIEPMLLLRTEKLPEGTDFQYELIFDGYRALAEGRSHEEPRNRTGGILG